MRRSQPHLCQQLLRLLGQVGRGKVELLNGNHLYRYAECSQLCQKAVGASGLSNSEAAMAVWPPFVVGTISINC